MLDVHAHIMLGEMLGAAAGVTALKMKKKTHNKADKNDFRGYGIPL